MNRAYAPPSVWVVVPAECGGELYVFVDEQAATAFHELGLGLGEVREEPLLDQLFVKEARAVDEERSS